MWPVPLREESGLLKKGSLSSQLQAFRVELPERLI